MTKDIYIKNQLKEMLVNFLTKKTGLEWYMFRRPSEITNAIKPYLMERVNSFSEARINFTRSEYEETIDCIQQFNRNYRITFNFTKEEYTKIKDKAIENGISNLVNFINTILYSLCLQSNKNGVLLKDFVNFFFSKETAIHLVIPFEINEKLKKTSYCENRQAFFRKALFWQIYFSQPQTLETPDDDFYRVTPEKTGWTATNIIGCSGIKKYIKNRKLGSTNNIVLLKILNNYLAGMEGMEISEFKGAVNE